MTIEDILKQPIENKPLSAILIGAKEVKQEITVKIKDDEPYKVALMLEGYLGNEVASSLLELYENNVISNIDLAKFTQTMEGKYNHLFKLAASINRIDDAAKDYSIIYDFIYDITNRALAKHQQNNNLMCECLRTIFKIKLLRKSISFFSAAYEYKEVYPMNHLQLLEYLFEREKTIIYKFSIMYKQVSNNKFNFNIYESLFNKLSKANRSEYEAIIKNVLN